MLNSNPVARRCRPDDACGLSKDSRRPSMCVPGCMEAVHATLSRRGFFTGATAAGFAVTALSSLEAEAKTQPKEMSPASAERTGSHFNAVLYLTHTMSPNFPTFFGVPGIELQK